jgi:ABC-2 type transport system permease protein
MTSQTDIAPQSADDAPSPPIRGESPTRPFYWSVRRELWENRSIYVAPLVVAALILFGDVISSGSMADKMRLASALTPARQAARLAEPREFIAMLLVVTGLVVAAVYCLGALHNERRDRSILFWKSLPVSNFTTVLSKASIPLVVLPMVIFAVVVATQLIVTIWGSLVLVANGLSAAPLWTEVPFAQMTLVLLYGLAAIALWYAPVYGWLILVSGWARRAAFLWAVLPPIGLCIVEKIAFDSSNLASVFSNRITGFAGDAFNFDAPGGMSEPLRLIDPIRYLSSPGLWLGLLAAAGFLATAVWLRRRRDPI